MARAFAAGLVCAALAAAGGAQAKAPLSGMDLCGASGCTHIAWPEAEQLAIGWSQGLARPAAFEPFYALHLRWSATEEKIVYWVPTANAVRQVGATGMWTHVNSRARTILDQSAAGIDPFRVEPIRVTVGGRDVRAPQTYVQLFRRGTSVVTWPATPWLVVKIETALPSPWSAADTEILLAPRGRFVSVDGWVLRIPKAVAQRALRGLPLR